MTIMKSKELPDHVRLQRTSVAHMAREHQIKEATFVAGKFEEGDGFVLVLSYIPKTREKNENSAPKIGILYKQNDSPRVFQTPEAVMGNARKLGIPRYSIDAVHWAANYYKPYKAMVRAHKARSRTNASEE